MSTATLHEPCLKENMRGTLMQMTLIGKDERKGKQSSTVGSALFHTKDPAHPFPKRVRGRWGDGQDSGSPQHCLVWATLANSSWCSIPMNLGQDSGRGGLLHCGFVGAHRGTETCCLVQPALPELKR